MQVNRVQGSYPWSTGHGHKGASLQCSSQHSLGKRQTSEGVMIGDEGVAKFNVKYTTNKAYFKIHNHILHSFTPLGKLWLELNEHPQCGLPNLDEHFPLHLVAIYLIHYCLC